jgi:dimethylglycine dehydrogenase
MSHVENVADHYGGLAVFRPRACAVLQRLTDFDVADPSFPFMTGRRMTIGLSPAIIGRLSVTGEVGYEIYVPTAHLASVLKVVTSAVADVGGRWVGMYAVNSLRLEKSFGIWSREFSRDYTPRMAGLDRFVDYYKRSFLGRDAGLVDRDSVPQRRLVTLVIDTTDADATGYEPIFQRADLVGFVTSGGSGHCVEQGIAMGYVATSVPEDTAELTVTMLGEPPTRLNEGCRATGCHRSHALHGSDSNHTAQRIRTPPR